MQVIYSKDHLSSQGVRKERQHAEWADTCGSGESLQKETKGLHGNIYV